jgi:hypothetical protein
MSDEQSGFPGFLVQREIEGANRRLPAYPLLRGDLLEKQNDGTYLKACPGIMVGGFVLTEEQVAELVPVQFRMHGLEYEIL